MGVCLRMPLWEVAKEVFKTGRALRGSVQIQIFMEFNILVFWMTISEIMKRALDNRRCENKTVLWGRRLNDGALNFLWKTSELQGHLPKTGFCCLFIWNIGNGVSTAVNRKINNSRSTRYWSIAMCTHVCQLDLSCGYHISFSKRVTIWIYFKKLVIYHCTYQRLKQSLWWFTGLHCEMTVIVVPDIFLFCCLLKGFVYHKLPDRAIEHALLTTLEIYPEDNPISVLCTELTSDKIKNLYK